MRFDDLVLLNPAVPIKKGQLAPFVEMAALPSGGRDIKSHEIKPFSGSGARFVDGDTLIARITPCLENGKGAQVANLGTGRPGFGSTEFIVARAKSPSDAKFVYYVTRSEAFRDLAIARMEGTSGRQRVSWQQLASIEIEDLSPHDRAAAGELLGALDDKIEVNRKAASVLEEMARALYRSWFVSFDPVQAKSERRPPMLTPSTPLPEPTAALFPDSFGDDGLPEGWKRQSLLDVLDLLSGGTPKTAVPEYWDGSIPWASAKDVSQCGQLFLNGTERTITEAGLENSSTKIIPQFATVVVARGATTGRACMFGQDIAMNQTCYALRSKRSEPFFANCLFMAEVLQITLAAHGSVFDTITTKTLQATEVAVPPPQLTAAFETTVAPLFLKILALSKESQTLATLRDSLLPRLMSGELRVGEARERVEEVA